MKEELNLNNWIKKMILTSFPGNTYCVFLWASSDNLKCFSWPRDSLYQCQVFCVHLMDTAIMVRMPAWALGILLGCWHYMCVLSLVVHMFCHGLISLKLLVCPQNSLLNLIFKWLFNYLNNFKKLGKQWRFL